jgi:sulfite exporter TauE/SafE
MDNAMENLDLASMILLGLLGTGHCMGMCGPLVIAFPGHIKTLSAHAWYHLGRVFTYTGIGFVLGMMSRALQSLGGMAHLQVGMSALAALFLLLFGLSRSGLINEPKVLQAANLKKLPGFGAAIKASGRKRSASMLPIGLLLGFIPCGLSYAAFARAFASGGALEGGLLLVAFGAGTLPWLFVLGTAASKFMVKYRSLSDVLSGMLMIAMAVDLGADVIQAIF